MLTRVLTAGDAEPKLKVEALEQLLTEVMPLDHAEVIDGLLPDRELYPAAREQGKDRLSCGTHPEKFLCGTQLKHCHCLNN